MKTGRYKEKYINSQYEPINFVWIGPPEFTQGGQDVVGIDSFSRNFKAYGQRNPLIFWCQDEYKQAYIDYFQKNGIDATVKSIEGHLESEMQGQDEFVKLQAQKVYEIYHQFMSPERIKSVDEQVQMKDKVRMKDLFFLFLVATQGGYVLDTNVIARDKIPVKMPSYHSFRYQTRTQRDTTAATIWMEYSPRNNLQRAQLSLDLLIGQHTKQTNLLDATKENENFGTGDMVLKCVTINHIFDSPHDMTWKAHKLSGSSDYFIEGMSIAKEILKIKGEKISSPSSPQTRGSFFTQSSSKMKDKHISNQPINSEEIQRLGIKRKK